MATFKICENDDELARVSLFILAHKRDVHPTFDTVDTITLLYHYLTQGSLFMAVNDDNEIIAASAFYQGTPERDFQDKDIALVDLAIIDRAHRGTRTFLVGLKSLIDSISCKHPEVKEIRLVALSDNSYLCRLYAKFSSASYIRDGIIGQETVYCEKISQIRDTLKKHFTV